MPEEEKKSQPDDPFKPYNGRFETCRSLPAKGRDKDEIIKELSTMADEENTKWQTGQVSDTFYHAAYGPPGI